MKDLNYHHLLYFWTVARLGTVTAACEELGLAQPTISGQLRVLENHLGRKLFRPAGRRLELTESGRLVYRYANEIFSLGRELSEALAGRPAGQRLRFRVGIADALPKTLAARALQPAFESAQPLHVVCYEGKPSDLLPRLSVHELDVVLADGPAGLDSNVRAFSHQLGECPAAVFAPRAEAERYRKSFPHSLDAAPFVLPSANTALRRMLDFWLARREVRPSIVAEVEDSALMKTIAGQRGALFAGPAAVAAEIERLYDVAVAGEIPEVRERFFAISLERRVKHPGVLAVVESAHRSLFGKPIE